MAEALPLRRPGDGARDPAASALGAGLAAVVHGLVLVLALRAGKKEGAAARATETARPDIVVIEGALLKLGGGGMYDPRTVHRTVPVRAEQRAGATDGLAPSQARPTTPGGSTRPDPNALITDRDIAGRGNQDFAERLERMAESEQPTFPGAPPGPGSPDGSVHGTETRADRAGTGATAKLQSYLYEHLHITATMAGAARRTWQLRIVVSADGATLTGASIVSGSGDDMLDADLRVQLMQLVENHTPIPDLTDDEKAGLAGRGVRVRYAPQ